MSDPNDRVTCPRCNKGYRWQASLSGRHVPCKQCGSEFKVPGQPGVGLAIQPEPSSDGDTYDLDVEDDSTHKSPAAHAKPATNGKCPSCNSPVRPAAVLCMNCGFNMAEGKRLATQVAQVPADEDSSFDDMTKKQKREADRLAAAHAEHWWMSYKLPMIIIAIGLSLALINIAALGPLSPMVQNIFGSTLNIIVGLTIQTIYVTTVHSILLFVGLLILVKLFGAGFGTLTTVLLRVLGISLVAQEAEFMVTVLLDISLGTGGLGWMISWAIYLVLMIGLCVKLLDVDMTEFRVLIWFIIIGQVATNYTVSGVIDLFL